MYIFVIKKNLQLVQNINLFQKVEDDIQINLFEQHLQRTNIKILSDQAILPPILQGQVSTRSFNAT